MNKEEYYKRLEKTTEKIKTDRCSEDEIANINRQKLYLAEHYITGLEQENQKYKEVIDKVSSQIKLYGKYNGEKCTRGFSMMSADFNKLLDLLKEVIK